jgi:hypothetical protein
MSRPGAPVPLTFPFLGAVTLILDANAAAVAHFLFIERHLPTACQFGLWDGPCLAGLTKPIEVFILAALFTIEFILLLLIAWLAGKGPPPPNKRLERAG